MTLDPERVIKLQHELDHLRKQHKELDKQIELLLREPYPNDLMIHQLKREKLRVKDLMSRIEALLLPDIIA